jgi:hypothetical protein
MRNFAKDLYVAHTGSDEPCTEEQLRQLVIRTIATRLQVCCGLSIKMRLNFDDTEVLMTVKADINDLRIEAARSQYLLQTHNHPFLKSEQYGEYVSHSTAPGFNQYFKEKNPQDYAKSIDLCRDRCDTDHPHPAPDPGLYRSGWQPGLTKYLRKKGVTEVLDENDDPKNTVCIAPYAKYRIAPEYRPLFRHYRDNDGNLSEFRQVDRIRLVNMIIGRHINIAAMKSGGFLKKNFVLHDEAIVAHLVKNWIWNFRVNPLMTPTPLLEIRDYLGEKIALYFAWLEFYTRELVTPAGLGVFAFIISLFGGRKLILVAYAMYICVWSTLIMERWKRQQAFLNLVNPKTS